jgi:glycyl-tRNA synthetase beta chain
VRPLTGIIALLGDHVVPFEIAGITSGRSTRGHRFMSHGAIEIAHPRFYAAELRDAHVILDPAERRDIILTQARKLAADAGLTLIEDDGLATENAGLTEWPVPLLGKFDPAFLDVPPEVIQLTMRTNQKYFAAQDAAGKLAPVFIAVANIEANDGGAAIAAGNARVLSARLSDAKYFWDGDVAKVREHGLEAFTPKLADIVFHEKLGTVADKVERVAKLARWLIESGAINSSPRRGEDDSPPASEVRGLPTSKVEPPHPAALTRESPSPHRGEGSLADMAELAARLCKADLTTGTVGEFPEVQGLAGGYLARIAQPLPFKGGATRAAGAAGVGASLTPLPQEVADAIRDHYKPVGQGDDVPTAPVSVAVALADKLDTLATFFAIDERPTGSRDPFALRRQILGALAIIAKNRLRVSLSDVALMQRRELLMNLNKTHHLVRMIDDEGDDWNAVITPTSTSDERLGGEITLKAISASKYESYVDGDAFITAQSTESLNDKSAVVIDEESFKTSINEFMYDRIRVRLRDIGIKQDVINAVVPPKWRTSEIDLIEEDLEGFISGEAGVGLDPYSPPEFPLWIEQAAGSLDKILQTKDGQDAIYVYRRVVNILSGAKVPYDSVVSLEIGAPEEVMTLARWAEGAKVDIQGALLLRDYAAAIRCVATGRMAVDEFFEKVRVNDPDIDKRIARLRLLEVVRRAVLTIADFSKIEG